MTIFKLFKFFITSGLSIFIILTFSFFGIIVFWIFSRILNYIIGKHFFTFSFKEPLAYIILMQKKQISYFFKSY